MGDLLKDLAQTKPPTPEVDPVRMERDLEQIIAMPRVQRRGAWMGDAAFRRRLAPMVVAFGVAAVLMFALLPITGKQAADSSGWWHVRTSLAELALVGEDANPYVLEIRSETDDWLSPQRQVTIYQQHGHVGWWSENDLGRWKSEGSPTQVRLVGGDQSLRLGPFRTAVREGDHRPSPYESGISFDELNALPTSPSALEDVLEDIVARNSGSAPETYRVARLAMGLTALPLRVEQRRAAIELLRQLPGVRDNGVGLALPAPARKQFVDLETQLVVDLENARAIIIQDVTKSAQHGLPAGTVVATEDFRLVELTKNTPALPTDVAVNGKPDTPFIMGK